MSSVHTVPHPADAAVFVSAERGGRPERRVFGAERVPQPLPASKLIMLTQMRAEENSRLAQLTESVGSEVGLINPVEVAKMSADRFAEYIDFANFLWGSTHQVEDFEDYRCEDGTYWVVDNGHTRVQACVAAGEADGYGPDMVDIMAYVLDDPDVYGMLTRQDAENIHSTVSQDRRAMGVVGQYLYGLLHGHWQSQAEFIRRRQGKVPRQLLSDGLAFVELPPEVREFAFEGTMPYGAAVALGRARRAVADYMERHYPAMSPEHRHEAVEARIRGRATHIQRNGWNATAAKLHIKGWLAAYLPPVEDTSAPVQEAFELTLYTPEEQAQMELERARAEYREELVLLLKGPLEPAERILRLHVRAGLDETELRGVLERVDEVARRLGSSVLEVLQPQLVAE